MSDNDYFPEVGYDPTTGEYSSDFDFEPAFSARVFFNDEMTVGADIFAPADFEPEAQGVLNTLNELIASGIFDDDYNPRNPNDLPEIPFDFDYGDKNIRGPFIGPAAVDRFLNQSGLHDIALVYYDFDYDEFWIDVNTN